MPKPTDLEPTSTPGVKRDPEGRLWIRPRGTDPRTGRRIDRGWRKATARTELGAAKELAAAAAEADRIGLVRRERQKVRAFASSWYARKLPGLSVGTAERYRVAIEQHFLPVPIDRTPLGDWYVDALVPEVLVAWRDDRAAAHYDARRGRGDEPVLRTYGARTVNGWLRVVKELLADAFGELRLGESPAARLHALPEEKIYGDDDPNLLDAGQLGAFLAALHAEAPTMYPLILWMTMTGCRQSEATGARFVDVVDGVWTIQRSAVRGHVRNRTKTNVVRRVPLHPLLVEVLETQRAALEREAAELSRRRQEIVPCSPWIFPSSTGRPRYGTTLAKPIRRALVAAGLGADLVRPHGLRRTLNDLLRQVAAQVEVQKAITGHSTDGQREHYSHVRVAERAAAIARVAEVVPFRKPSSS